MKDKILNIFSKLILLDKDCKNLGNVADNMELHAELILDLIDEDYTPLPISGNCPNCNESIQLGLDKETKALFKKHFGK